MIRYKKNAKLRDYKSLSMYLILVFCVVFVFAAPIFVDVLTPTGTTENSSVEIEYNITEANLKEVKFNWNGTNTTIFDENVVLMMNFDNRSALGEDDTTIFDISGNGNNGTIVGNNNITWNPNGKYNGAFNFSGSSSSIQFNVSNPSFPELTSCVWVSPKQIGVEESIVWIFGDGLIMKQSENGFLRLYVSNSTSVINYFNGDQTLVVGEWHQFCAVYNGTNSFIYFDGVLDKVSSTTISGLLDFSVTTKHKFGANFDGSNTFNGSLDDLIIMNRSLDSDEIKYIYESQLTKYDNNNYSFYINKSMLTNTTGIPYDYYLCAANSTDSENCTTSKTITRLPESETVIANFSSSIGDIRSDFYGAATNTFYFGNSTNNRIDTNNDGSLDSPINRSWHKEKWEDGNIVMNRFIIGTNSYYVNTSDPSGVNFTGEGSSSIYDMIESVKYNAERGAYTLIQIKRVPEWLADNSTGYCTTYLTSCPPSNYTKYANIINDIDNRLTSGGVYSNYVYYEWQNEPYGIGGENWLSDLVGYDNVTGAIMYAESFNNITSKLSSLGYDNIRMGGPSGYWGAPNYLITFLTNVTNNYFISYHSYPQDYLNDDFKDELDLIIGNCSLANCSYIMMSEGNNANVTLKNNSLNINRYGASLGSAYTNAHNYYAGNISYLIWQWQEEYSYYNNVTNYPEYPQKYAIVSEPDLDNELTIAYNVTKNFATFHSAGSTVYTSTSSQSALRPLTTTSGNDNYITIINTDSEARNMTINDLPSGIEDLVGQETGTSYSVSSGSVNVGVLDSFGILYLADNDNPPVITVLNPTFQDDENTQPIEFVITTDEEANCVYSIDGGSNTSMTTSNNLTHRDFKVGDNGVHTAIYSCTDNLGNIGTSTEIYTVSISANPVEGGAQAQISPFEDSNITTTNITDGDNITLFEIEKFHTQWFVGEENKLDIRTRDVDGNLLDVDSVEVLITDDIRHNIDVTRSNAGKYRARVVIFDQNISSVNLTIIATQPGKTITDSIEISLEEKTATAVISNFFREKMKFLGELIQENKLLTIIVVLVAIGLIVLFSIISAINRK